MAVISRGRRLNRSRLKYSPSSRRTTSRPRSASSLATVAQPAAVTQHGTPLDDEEHRAEESARDRRRRGEKAIDALDGRLVRRRGAHAGRKRGPAEGEQRAALAAGKDIRHRAHYKPRVRA